VCGLFGLVTSVVVMRWSAEDVILRAFGPLAMDAFRNTGRAACEASPSTWSAEIDRGVVTYAYDATTRRSQNPAAPPLDETIFASIPAPPASPMAVRAYGPPRGGRVVFVGAQSGPCAIVQTTWQPRFGRPTILWGLLATAGLVSFLATSLGFWSIVRPLARRIARLSRAAEQVGESDRWEPIEDGSNDELTQVAESLDRAHRRIRADAGHLETRQRELQRHLADVTHDLRTPIASLQIAIEQAEAAITDPSTKELLSSALRDAVYLAGLNDNLRLASDLRDGFSPAGHRTDLAAVVSAIGARSTFYAARRGISLETAVPDGAVMVDCHTIAAEQAVRNLVENAIAYGDRDGHIALMLEIEGDSFLLTVVDDGPGVAPSELARLGERTFRSDEARARDPRGSGLGLAITNEICARCGFELAFANETPRGLRVTIRGPRDVT
jgi:signal transduction histidine kinase